MTVIRKLLLVFVLLKLIQKTIHDNICHMQQPNIHTLCMTISHSEKERHILTAKAAIYLAQAPLNVKHFATKAFKRVQVQFLLKLF